MRHLPITVYFAFVAILAGALVCPSGGQAQTKKPAEKTQAQAGSAESEAQAYHTLSKAELDCIVRMLGASTLAQAKARKAVCKDSFVLRAYYASLLIQLHAPGADGEIVRNMPQNLGEMHAFRQAIDTFYADNYANYSGMLMIGHAYERYYNSLFRIATERPSLLPRVFPIAGRFGAPSGDNVDEEEGFDSELHDIYKKIPAAYMRAVRQTKNKEYRDYARNCALHPVP